MAAQDVRELIPRVRRAVEGPVAPVTPLTDDQVTAMAADALADVILLTAGAWGHTLAVTHRTTGTNYPDQWAVDPPLAPEEETVVAAQAAISYFYHSIKDTKVSERIAAEGREWEWSTSASTLRDWLKLLQQQRDDALAALTRAHPALARYASILQVRDAVGAAYLEPWVPGSGLGGGQALLSA